MAVGSYSPDLLCLKLVHFSEGNDAGLVPEIESRTGHLPKQQHNITNFIYEYTTSWQNSRSLYKFTGAYHIIWSVSPNVAILAIKSLLLHNLINYNSKITSTLFFMPSSTNSKAWSTRRDLCSISQALAVYHCVSRSEVSWRSRKGSSMSFSSYKKSAGSLLTVSKYCL